MANTLSSLIPNAMRAVVSRQRIRYKENGFDLDLAYICNNIIAMGYPAENIESVYRNNLEDVFQFFEGKHRDHYKIYNLCSERNYDVSKFHGRVSVYPFDDHNPPPIMLIQEFCNDVDSWLKLDGNNVAAVHCKAGKGRTGTMICCYLLHSGFKTTAEDALAYYDEKRTKNRKGVTIPSQRRYVEYYSKLLNGCSPYEDRKIQLLEIRFSSQLTSQDMTCNVSERTNDGKCQLIQNFSINFRKTLSIEIKDSNVCLTGDLKIEVCHKALRKKEKLFHFWLNTYFLVEEASYNKSDDTRTYELPKCELDDAHKDTVHKTIPEEFKIQLVFKLVPQDQIGNSISCNVNNVKQGNLQNHQNHNNQVSNNWHHHQYTTKPSAGPISSVFVTDVVPLQLPLNQHNLQQHQQHNNQKHPQNIDSNPTKRKHQQNHWSHNTNNSVECVGVVLRNSDEEIPVKQQPQQGNNDVPIKHTPSVSKDVSRTNSSSSSSSPSEASSNAGEDWESGEFNIKAKDEMIMIYKPNHSMLNNSSSNCNGVQLSEVRRNNNNNNRNSSIDKEERINASNNSGSSTSNSSKLISTTAGSSTKSKFHHSMKAFGLHNIINNNSNKKLLRKKRWISNIKSNPDLCDTLVKSANYCKNNKSSSIIILGQNRTNSTTENDDYYSSLCDTQLSFGGASPIKSPQSIAAAGASIVDVNKSKNMLKHFQCLTKDKQQQQKSNASTNNVVIAKPIESHSIGFNIFTDTYSKDLSKSSLSDNNHIASEKQQSNTTSSLYTSSRQSCKNSVGSNCLMSEIKDSCDKKKLPLVTSSSPPPCTENGCLRFRFRTMKHELQSMSNNSSNTNNSGKICAIINSTDRSNNPLPSTSASSSSSSASSPSPSSGGGVVLF